MFASQLSGHCDVISNRLWRHQQNVKWAKESRGRRVKILVFNVIYGFIMSCKKNNVCTLVTNRLCAHSSVILVFISIVAATREINTKITLSWAHKQFATRVNTLFYVYSWDMPRPLWHLLQYVLYIHNLKKTYLTLSITNIRRGQRSWTRQNEPIARKLMHHRFLWLAGIS